MEPKYKLTDQTKTLWDGTVLCRIEALREGYWGLAGIRGGWIEAEENLSHEGNCWVYGNAQISGNAEVSENAWVFGNAEVFDNARVFGNAMVYGYALVYGNARVCGNASVHDSAWVYENARVSQNDEVYGDTKVYGNKENEPYSPQKSKDEEPSPSTENNEKKQEQLLKLIDEEVSALRMARIESNDSIGQEAEEFISWLAGILDAYKLLTKE